jgi:hypothetical protein
VRVFILYIIITTTSWLFTAGFEAPNPAKRRRENENYAQPPYTKHGKTVANLRRAKKAWPDFLSPAWGEKTPREHI